ncbi:MAG: hypothetical protein HG458_007200 [Prevotella sp.]|nr:hypothetical protein [Prevotella sp.]
MRNLFLLCVFTFYSVTTRAQNDSIPAKNIPLPTPADSALTLQEVHVKAARVVTRNDGYIYFPSAKVKEAATNGYSLLGRIGLPHIRIDEIRHTITALNNLGSVELQLNGAKASQTEIISLDPKTILRIHFIDNPGLRYGEDIAYVINIVTQRTQMGYSLGTDLTNAVTTYSGHNTVYTNITRQNSEWGLNYDFGYQDARGGQSEEQADYLLNNGTHNIISRTSQDTRMREFNNKVQLKYSLTDSLNNIFQARLSNAFSHSPTDLTHILVDDGTSSYLSLQKNSALSFNPTLDLYLSRRLGSQRSFTANLVVTHINTDENHYNNEGGPYEFSVHGNVWSLLSEAIYETRLKPFTLSAGYKGLLKYTYNHYTGDVLATTPINNGSAYLYVEAQGKLSKLNYSAGIGTSFLGYHQNEHRYNFWLFRPKVTISYQPIAPLTLKYGFEVSPFVSRIAMISNTAIRGGSREWSVGNPDLKPSYRIENFIDATLTLPRLTTNLNVMYWTNRNCNMALYTRSADDRFYYTQKNQKGIDMLYCTAYAQYQIIPDKLSCFAAGYLTHFANHGDNYEHRYTAFNYNIQATAYLGRWTISLTADNGWRAMEGETIIRQGAQCVFNCSYRMGNCTLSLMWLNPFRNRVKEYSPELINRFLHRQYNYRSTDSSNQLSVSFVWRLQKGHRSRTITQTLNNRDTENGIMK